jgi:GTPase
LAFVDETVIEVSSGHGGPGASSFRREKYVPRGGPDGGDGGCGGDVIFVVKENLKTLSHIAYKHIFAAEDGSPGEKRKRHGRDGKSEIIEVPPGTVIKSIDEGRLIRDLTGEDKWLFLKGGKGGKGNVHFATPSKQAPRYAQPGLAGETTKIRVELNLIADVGFVGMPNAGKSTLLAALTNADPKIGAYPFTTKVPNLGVLRESVTEVILADIPGLIEGASQGAGLGIRFLKHITRTTSLAFLVDLTDDEEYAQAFPKLLAELEEFGGGLDRKKRILIGTKLDLLESQDRLDEVKKLFPEEEVIGISSFSFVGLDVLRRRLVTLMQEE